MNRRYTNAEYKEIVDRIRRNFDNSSITTDVMVGFPGETEEEFNNSLEFVSVIAFAKVHVFPYSRRSGTVADRMPMQLEKNVKESRAAIMINATEKSRRDFLSSQVGKECEVLFERLDKNGLFEGYTQNYTLVSVDSKGKDLQGNCLKVKITSVSDDRCIGVLSNSIS